MEKKTKKSKKNRRWIRPRHTVIRHVIYWPFRIYSRLVYGIRIENYPKDAPHPCLILYNHQTPFDQFFVGLSFPKHVYYVASEDLFSNSWLSRLLSWAVAPIPFRKSTSDLTAIKNCLRIAREGGTIAMAPEGNRTYSGTTEHIKAGVASLAKALGLPIAIFRIEGGYGACPRWSDTVRKGRMRGYYSRIVLPEEYASMSKEELFDLLQQELYVDERLDPTPFYTKRPAEYLDRAMYYCPTCGLTKFHSEGDTITCRTCGLAARYLPDKRLEAVAGPFPYPYVKEWYDAQCAYVRGLDMAAFGDKPLCEDTVCLQDNLYCQKKVVLDKAATLRLYSDRFTLTAGGTEMLLPFETVSSATVLGRNKFNIYYEGRILQCKGDKHFNALKYLNLYFHAIHKEQETGEPAFLGL
ncbi:MAG: 1-acyl-sn-glycerol-3-phosphate acyltransferase [Clostridia bacterium]|nr:1-acyl-sn-glycerol-3-phosphate acyltransferase [Clostridia bacterium]